MDNFRQLHPRPIVLPHSKFERVCHVCGSSFLSLAWGRTGESGLWRDWRWYCSLECWPFPYPMEDQNA